jgi:hypothetical protein
VKYLLKNKTRQGLNLNLKTSTGKVVSALLPALGTKEITAAEMSQDVLDKTNKGYLEYMEVHEPAPKK